MYVPNSLRHHLLVLSVRNTRRVLYSHQCHVFTNSKYNARGTPIKPLRHMYFIGLAALSALAGFVAGQVAPMDEKKVPSPFLLEDIAADVRKSLEFSPEVAAGIIALAYMQCISLVIGKPPGDSHVVDQVCADILDSLTKIHKIQLGDALAFAATEAVRFLGGPEVQWRYGRKQRNVLANLSEPNNHSSWKEVLEFHTSLGFTPEETVAIMACHGVGKTRSTSLPLQWKERKYKLNNEYYKNLLNNSYETPHFSLLGFALLKGPNHLNIAALPYEIEMASQSPTKDIVKRFAENQDDWTQSFTTGFQKLLEMPWKADDFREYIPLQDADKIRKLVQTRRESLSKDG